ncbi:hypothetical protein B0T26DRAFT_751085 [Lasiosphaeria miniovina]|uniref:Uncharacterized protein n=1 Tax=Lasiosphaeria miniovina TaxID=1954250 RepID=A0AA40AJK4_9PEZI|nr:uncharacterized protein B0T26DRAFT_751085 [Lasiosphaeria miniovina]KAK0716950.1 hypothetical protein B0T26DRAFT_751085 [Lasiosphaeria miniovina]
MAGSRRSSARKNSRATAPPATPAAATPGPRPFFDPSGPESRVVNEMPAGAKGLVASRWATPSTAPQQTAAPAPAYATVVDPATPFLEPSGQQFRVVNDMPASANGLAASRWATPSNGTQTAAPTITPAAITLAAITPVAITPAAITPAAAQATPFLLRPGLQAHFINQMPADAKGLAASRWA